MAGLSRRFRDPSVKAALVAGMLLVVAGLTSGGKESTSFGHSHLSHGHTAYHHHVYFGPHEHPEAQPASVPVCKKDGEDREAPASQEREGPRRTVTVPAAPALFQPVAAVVPAAPLAFSTPLAVDPAPAPVLQPALRQASPRAPPSSLAVPGFLT